MTQEQKDFMQYFRTLTNNRRYYPEIAYNVSYVIPCRSEETGINPYHIDDFINKLSKKHIEWFRKFKFPIVSDFSLDSSQKTILSNITNVLDIEYNPYIFNNKAYIIDLLYKIIEEDEEYNDTLLLDIIPCLKTKIMLSYNDKERLVVEGRAYANKVICVIEHLEECVFNEDINIWVNSEHRYIGNIWNICTELENRFPLLSPDTCKCP